MRAGRAVMIRYQDDQGVDRAGSGLRIGGNRVLTAAHVAAGIGYTVILASSEPDATVMVRSSNPEIDLAVLEISIPDGEGLPPLGYARVDRDTVATIEGCTALGYPAFKKDRDGYRRCVQVGGFIPTAEGFTARPGTGTTAGYLSLKATGPAIRGQDPLPGGDLESTPWAGMSGAVAFDRNDRILGVVRHHNQAEGAGTLALTPLDAIDRLPEPERNRFWTALGVTDPDLLPRLPGRGTLLRDGFRALLQHPDYAVFAGRGDAVDTVEEFLAGPGGILAVTAPAGLGKTALLARLVRDNPDRFAYHVFTNRYFPSWLDEAFFLRNMLEQLEPAGAAAELQTLDLPELQARFQHRLGELSGSSAPAGRVLLLDGLDEVTGWSPAPYLSTLPREIHVIVSIRDTGQDWRSQYGIQSARLLRLDGFDRDAVTAVFTATGEHAGHLIGQPGALDTVMAKASYTAPGTQAGNGPVIHGADPLHIRFLAEDANDPAATLAAIADQPAGFSAYLERWWKELKGIAGNEPVQNLLAVLTAALGPLTRNDLEVLVPDLFAGWADDSFDDEVLPRIRRMVTGTDETGYSFVHPRLRSHLATPKHVSPKSLESARMKLLGYCRDWAERDSLYALTFYPSHQAETDPAALPGLYRNAAYLEAATQALGIDRVTGTLRTRLATDLPVELKSSLRWCLQLLDREAHHLRPPFPLDSPGYVARQLGLQALTSEDTDFADEVRRHLTSLSTDQLIPAWSSARTSPALVRTLKGHGRAVNAVAMTADGARAVTAGGDDTARVWDLGTGTTLRLLEHSNVRVVAVTSNGTRAVTAAEDGSVRIWDLDAGITLHAFKGSFGGVSTMALTPDDSRVITAGWDGIARVWDMASGTIVHNLSGHTGGVTTVIVTGDGTGALTASYDGTVRLWDLRAGTVAQVLAGHADEVTAVAVTPDGTRAVTAGADRTARVWDLGTGNQLHTLAGHSGAVTAVAVTPDGTRAVTAGDDGTARVWDLATGNQLHTLAGHTNGVTAVAVTADSKRAVTTGQDHTARLWDLDTGATLLFLQGHVERVSAVAVTSDGARALTASWDGVLCFWNLGIGTTLDTTEGHIDRVTAVAVTPDGHRALTASSDHTARLWELATGTTVHTLTGHTGAVTAVAVTPDGTRALTVGDDNTPRLWDLATGTTLHTLEGHSNWVTAVAATPDGTRAVTASQDGTARVWDLAAGTEIHSLTGHTRAVTAVAITSDSTRALTASQDGTARLWDLATGMELHAFTGHAGAVSAVAVTPDGTRALTASYDGTARLWDLATGTELHALTGHTRWVPAVAVTPDGTRALTASWDNTARLWDLATGTELLTLTGHTESVTASVVTPDGACALTASWDGTARLWDLARGVQLQAVTTVASLPTCIQIAHHQGTLTLILGEASGAVTVLAAHWLHEH